MNLEGSPDQFAPVATSCDDQFAPVDVFRRTELQTGGNKKKSHPIREKLSTDRLCSVAEPSDDLERFIR